MEQPKVTIITATYNLIKNNRKDYFVQALESVHNQSYKNIEHLIIDGGSEDGTIDLLEEYQNKGWIKYYSEPDKGIYDAFNKGIEKANGKYIAFLNSDDFYANTSFISKSVKNLELYSCVFSYSDTLFFEENGNQILKKANLMNLFSSVPFMHVSMLVTKEALCKQGKFNSSFKIAADYNFILKLFLQNQKGTYIKNVTPVYRTGGFSCIDEKKTENDRVNALKNAFLPKKLSEEQINILIHNKISIFWLYILCNIFGFNKILFTVLGSKFLYHIKNYRQQIISFRISRKRPYFKILGYNVIRNNK